MSKTLSLAWGLKIMEPTKCDVYSFGIILLETMSVVWKKCRDPPSKEIREQWVNWQHQHCGSWGSHFYTTDLIYNRFFIFRWLGRSQAKRLEKRDLFDQQLVADDSNRVLALRCVLVGLICCLREPARRLSMEEVVVRIGGPCTEVVPAAAPSSSSAAQAIPRQWSSAGATTTSSLCIYAVGCNSVLSESGTRFHLCVCLWLNAIAIYGKVRNLICVYYQNATV